MPNWCTNYITISSSNENTIKKISKKISDSKKKRDKRLQKGSSNIISLLPDGFGIFKTLVGLGGIGTTKYKNGGWYDWNINRFGTKWDPTVDDLNMIEFDEDYIQINVDTAWSPPLGFCRLLSKKYKVHVECEYYESGCDFAGKLSIDENGMEEGYEYRYMKGVYMNDQDDFWNQIADFVDRYVNGSTIEALISDYGIDFLDESEVRELKEMWDEALNNNQ